MASTSTKIEESGLNGFPIASLSPAYSFFFLRSFSQFHLSSSSLGDGLAFPQYPSHLEDSKYTLNTAVPTSAITLTKLALI
jgi:hypothetical protein